MAVEVVEHTSVVTNYADNIIIPAYVDYQTYW
jgi:hypothetical protein